MNTQDSTNPLPKQTAGGADAEAAWDLRARSYGREQERRGGGHTQEVVEHLLHKGLLQNADVLDVGGGTGRYAVPFAACAREVTVTDISGNMLECAKENAEKAGRSNLRYQKLDWETADLQHLGWNRRFDLTFASMCLAVRSREGLLRMSAASRGWCQINQLIVMTDSIAQRLTASLSLPTGYDPHNDRNAVESAFHILWAEGFEPEVTYLRESGRQTLSVEEAAQRYGGHFRQAAFRNGLDLSGLLQSYAENGRIETENKTTLAMILWQASPYSMEKQEDLT